MQTKSEKKIPFPVVSPAKILVALLALFVSLSRRQICVAQAVPELNLLPARILTTQG